MTRFIGLSLALSALIACGCARAEQKQQVEPARERLSLSCLPSEDPFACLRTQCTDAGATFNETTKTCHCGGSKLFAIGSRGTCLSPQFDRDVISFNIDRELPTELTIDITTANRAFLIPLLPSLSLPIASEGRAVTSVFADAADFQSSIEKLPLSMQLDFINFYRPETYLYDETSNAAVTSRMISLLRRIYFQPAKLNSWAQFIQQPLAHSTVMASSEQGCAEICTVTSKLESDGRYDATRTQLYSGGGLYDDHITLSNTTDGEIAYTLVLLDGELSHVLKREPDNSVWLYDSAGTKVMKIQSAPVEERPTPLRFLPNAVPVALFEGFADEQVDRATLYGPYLDSHVYGWFKREDRKPFQLGRKLSRFSEESQPSSAHGRKVSELASRGFTQPLLPFFPEHLWNGDFDSFLTNFQDVTHSKFVGSLSFAYPMTPGACSKSGIAATFGKTSETALWTVAAGNSGQRGEKTKSLNCPQSLDADTLLVVAASGDGKRLSLTSTYGETYADIADLGCAHGETSCRDAATSYAAPRAARRLADLIEVFPNQDLRQIKLAVLLTARVPYQFDSRDRSKLQNAFLPVRSGGFIDDRAAKVFLENFRGNNLVQALTKAKLSHYSGLKNEEISRLIAQHLQRLQTLGVLK